MILGVLLPRDIFVTLSPPHSQSHLSMARRVGDIWVQPEAAFLRCVAIHDWICCRHSGVGTRDWMVFKSVINPSLNYALPQTAMV